jgi:hypothetical protein
MSVNTIVNTDGYLKAYNTDYTAVSKVIRSSELRLGSPINRLLPFYSSTGTDTGTDTYFQSGTVLSRKKLPSNVPSVPR